MTRKLGRTGTPGRSHVLSTRFAAPDLSRIRKLAEADGVTVSEWIRSAVASEVMRRCTPQAPPGYRVTGWACPHLHITSTAILSETSCGYGCEMQPVYQLAA